MWIWKGTAIPISKMSEGQLIIAKEYTTINPKGNFITSGLNKMTLLKEDLCRYATNKIHKL